METYQRAGNIQMCPGFATAAKDQFWNFLKLLD